MNATGGDVTGVSELAGYIAVAHEHVYTVLHKAYPRRARLLLLGPFATERSQAYLPLANWSRYLAQRGIEVLRLDYRGVGESTGAFEDMSFGQWLTDGRVVYGWLAQQSDDVPVYLHGLSLGALIAGMLFHEGLGDGLLLWEAPVHANAILRPALNRWVTLQQLSQRADDRQPVSHYVKRLDGEGSIEVDGYIWSANLWRDSIDFCLPDALRDEEVAARLYQRPVKSIALGRKGASLLSSGLRGYDGTGDFEWLYQASYLWMRSALATSGERTS